MPTTRGVLVLPRPGQRVDDALVARVSRSLRRADVLVLSLAEERVGVQRWRGGRLVDTPHYGVVGGVDGDAERVLLGFLPPTEASGATSTDGLDRAQAARAALARVRGPVRPWQPVLAGVLAVASALLAVAGVLDLTGEPGGSGWDAARAAVWGLLAVYWVASLRGLLLRRRGERPAPARPD